MLQAHNLPGLLVWVAEEEGEECGILALPRRRYGLERVPSGMAWGVAIVPGQAVPTERGRRFVCEHGMCVLKDMARPGAGRKLLPFKRASSGLLSKASVPGSSSLPFLAGQRDGQAAIAVLRE